MADLAELLERVKLATGPDRELDRAIAIWTFPELAQWPRSYCGGWVSDAWGLVAPPEPYTASLDAALALVERVLKPKLLEVSGGWNPANPAEWPAWTVRWYPPHVPKDGKSWWAQVETAPTPALALIATLLSVLLYEQQQAHRIAASDDVGNSQLNEGTK